MLKPKKYIIYSGLILAEPAITVVENRHGTSPELVRLPGYYGRKLSKVEQKNISKVEQKLSMGCKDIHFFRFWYVF